MKKEIYFSFQCEVTASDFWKLAMHRTYHSLAGVCNLVFTAAMFLLAVRFWEDAGDPAQVLMLSGCLLFPVIQPALVYGRARAQARCVTKDLRLEFDDCGLHVTAGTAGDRTCEDLPWERIVRVTEQPGMVILFTDARHGYLLTKRVLGGEREAFLAYVKAKTGDRK